jgi:mRNA interferase HicA
LEQNGCQFYREGSRHTVYHNPIKDLAAAVPRHTEIGTPVARAICKQLEIPLPTKK